MAITIPEGCFRQPTESESLSDAGEAAFSYVLKGDYDALKGLARTIVPGTEVLVEGSGNSAVKWFARNWQLQRGNGDTGVLTVSCTPSPGTIRDGQFSPTPLRETWTVHNVRNDVSAMRSCGESAANPQRDSIEMWLKETDKTLSDGYEYMDGSGSVQTLSVPSQALAAKLRRGIESVMRFHPVVTRRLEYAEPPEDFMDGLSFIDADVPVPGSSGALLTKHPRGLAGKLALYQWLKSQDDLDELPDGKWTRTESWMGILKADDPSGGNSPWDAELYGAGRWKFPAFPNGGGE